jgi:general secretion pathway protein K
MSAHRAATRAQRQRPRATPHGQRGIALLVAILLVALGTIIAAAVAYDNAMTARRGASTYAFDESVLIAQGAEALAAYGLRQIRQSDPNHIYPGQGWDKPLGPIEVVPGVMLEATLEDMQGRFNLNNLVKKDGTPDLTQVNAFVQLLMLVGVEPKWAGYLIDWIDVDIVPQNPDGAEDSVYMGQTPPYRTPNRYITSTTELLALPGFGRDRWLKIAPYVAALPYGTTINVCSAPGPVLDAFLGPGHTEFSANPEQLAQTRANTTGCFPTLANYQAAFPPKVWAGTAGSVTSTTGIGTSNGIGASTGGPVATSGGGLSQKFSETSSYFRLASFITIGSAEFNLYSLLYMDAGAPAGVGSASTGTGLGASNSLGSNGSGGNGSGGNASGGGGTVRPIQRSFTPD